jgi:hypothetical protein
LGAFCVLSNSANPRRAIVYDMTRRLDYRTAEQISLALLTRAAFGTESGVQHALQAGITPELIGSVFARDKAHIRHDLPRPHTIPDRRQHVRSGDRADLFHQQSSS